MGRQTFLYEPFSDLGSLFCCSPRHVSRPYAFPPLPLCNESYGVVSVSSAA